MHTDAEIVAAFRQILEEDVIPELRAIGASIEQATHDRNLETQKFCDQLASIRSRP